MNIYVGRIVSIAKTQDGRLCGIYRVSSRSFPNRTTLLSQDKASIIPKPGFESDVQRNPYIVYNAVRIVRGGEVAVVSNGSHTDPIAEKIDAGMGVRDALAYSLSALDYEKDQYNTPRIAAVADNRGEGAGWLGIVRDNGLEVRRIFLEPGRFWHVATYEEIHICAQPGGVFTPVTPEAACRFILGEGLFAERVNPVTAIAVMAGPDGFTLAAADAPAQPQAE